MIGNTYRHIGQPTYNFISSRRRSTRSQHSQLY